MKKICILVIWMGVFPESYPLWKLSVNANDTIDFFVITDQMESKREGNITYVHESMEDVKARFQKVIPFTIKLNTPYKICDYKPIFGIAYPEIVEDYDFWGHCDMDMVFGDIRHFLTDELLEEYDKIFDNGYLVLYRNSPEIKELYKKSDSKENMAYSYRKAFRTDYACYFDEYMGMSILGNIYCKTFRDQLTERMVQDFGWQILGFRSYITKDYFVFSWKNGKLYRHICNEFGGNIQLEGVEYLLVHIQKRKMHYSVPMEEVEEKKQVWIVPNQYLLERPEENLYTAEMAEEYERMIAVSDRKRRIRNLKNYGIIQYIPHMFRRRRICKWIVNVKKFF